MIAEPSAGLIAANHKVVTRAETREAPPTEPPRRPYKPIAKLLCRDLGVFFIRNIFIVLWFTVLVVSHLREISVVITASI